MRGAARHQQLPSCCVSLSLLRISDASWGFWAATGPEGPTSDRRAPRVLVLALPWFSYPLREVSFPL